MLKSLCSGTSTTNDDQRRCVSSNIARMKDVCKLIHKDIFEFSKSVRTFNEKYDITKNETFHQLSKSWGIPIVIIKNKYDVSDKARYVLKKLWNTYIINVDIVVEFTFTNSKNIVRIIRMNCTEVTGLAFQVQVIKDGIFDGWNTNRVVVMWDSRDAFKKEVLTPLFNSVYEINGQKMIIGNIFIRIGGADQ